MPRAVVVANWAKALLNSPVVWPWTGRFSAATAPPLETEIATMGRNDQLAPELPHTTENDELIPARI